MRKISAFVGIVAIMGIGTFLFDAPLISFIFSLMVFILNI